MPRSATPDAPDQPEAIFVSTKEVARVLGVSRNHVYELLNREAIEARYIGKRRMVLLASLTDFIEGLPTKRGAS